MTINKYGVIDGHKTFKGFTNVSNNLDRKDFFQMFETDKIFAKFPLSWKKSISYGKINPHKLRSCNTCDEDKLCDRCDRLVNQKKEISADPNGRKKQPPNEFGYMLPKYITT